MYKPTIALLLLLTACSRPPRTSPPQSAHPRTPAALLIEKVIDGNVMGQPLSVPIGLAASPGGELYLADNGNHRLVLFDSTLTPVREMGGYGFEAGLLNDPTFITLDNDLNLWVADEGNRRIVRYDARLNYVDEIELRDEDDPFKFGRPSGVAVAEYGEVWVADLDQDRIAVFDNAGRFDRFIGEYGYSGGQLRAPEKICRIPDDEFVVADAGNGLVVIYDSYGSFSRELGRNILSEPFAATLDGNFLWLLDAASAGILYLDLKADRLFRAVPLTSGSRGGLKKPGDIAVLADGRLVIADSGNNRLVVCRIMYEEPE